MTIYITHNKIQKQEQNKNDNDSPKTNEIIIISIRSLVIDIVHICIYTCTQCQSRMNELER